jgi:NAD(P)H dehydrogenase (quinone)
MSYVITGAAGNLGRRTAELMLERVDPTELVLVTRRPDEIADLAGRGADVRRADFDSPETLAPAFAGGERLLLISADVVGRRVAGHKAAIDAAAAAGVRHVAYTSIPNPTDANPAGVVPDHRATEEHLAASSLQWTFLRDGLYSEHRIPEAQAAVASGTFRHNLGDGRTAYVSRDDCAAAAAAVLSGGDEHSGRAYDITGPELIGAADLAGLYSEAGGKPVEAVNVSDAEFIDGLVAAGLPRGVGELLASFGAAIREGQLAALSSDVQSLTGRTPALLSSVLAAAFAGAA